MQFARGARFAALLAMAAMAVGHVHGATKDENSIPAPPPGKALVVVMITEGFLGSAGSWPVVCDRQLLGFAKRGCYFTAPVDTGLHVFCAGDREFALKMAADSTYFLRAGLPLELKRVSVVEAAEYLQDARRSKAPSVEVDHEIKEAPVPKGKALVYVMRLEESMKAGGRTVLEWDGTRVGNLRGARRFTYFVAEPGNHTIRQIGDPKRKTQSLKIESGRVYFFVQELAYGGGFDLQMLRQGPGRAALVYCRLQR